MAKIRYKNGNSWAEVPISGSDAIIGGLSSSMANTTTGTPAVEASITGAALSPTFKFSFSNLKGATGSPGGTGPTGPSGNVIAAGVRTNAAAQSPTSNSGYSNYFYNKSLNTAIGSYNFTTHFTTSTYYVVPKAAGYIMSEFTVSTTNLGWVKENNICICAGIQTSSTNSTTQPSTTSLLGLYIGPNSGLHSNEFISFTPRLFSTTTTSYFKWSYTYYPNVSGTVPTVGAKGIYYSFIKYS